MNASTQAIEENLRRLCFKIKKKGRAILSDVDITPPQFEALQYLIHGERMTIGALSAKMFLAFSTVTDLLDRMERNGLVKRVKDANDRRVVRIEVLDKGHALIDQVMDARLTYIDAVLHELDPELIRQIDHSLALFNQRVEL